MEEALLKLRRISLGMDHSALSQDDAQNLLLLLSCLLTGVVGEEVQDKARQTIILPERP